MHVIYRIYNYVVMFTCTLFFQSNVCLYVMSFAYESQWFLNLEDTTVIIWKWSVATYINHSGSRRTSWTQQSEIHEHGLLIRKRHILWNSKCGIFWKFRMLPGKVFDKDWFYPYIHHPSTLQDTFLYER